MKCKRDIHFGGQRKVRSDRRRRTVPTMLLLILCCASSPVLSEPAMAFHDGGTANCESCHVMHDAAPGQVLMNGSSPLLVAASASDVCLVCHGADDGVFSVTPTLPGNLRGAGDFVFLLEDNLNDGGSGGVLDGYAAGHSIISQAHGLSADPRRSHSPGGNYPSSQMGCTSCHDPHGNSNFRMLYGAGEIQGGLAVFVNPAPLATGLSVTDPLATERPDRHTAYQAGMSAWCGNCHGDYHDHSGNSSFEHPADENFEREIINQYNRYQGTGSPATGLATTSYLPEVPFEDAGAAPTSTAGPTTSSRLMCLTCHRAHASSAPAAGRWDFRVADLNQDGQVSGSYRLPNPYPGVGAQGQLCAKCHADDGPGSEYHSP